MNVNRNLILNGLFLLLIASGCSTKTTPSDDNQRATDVIAVVADTVVAENLKKLVEVDESLRSDSVAFAKDQSVKKDLVNRIERSEFKGWSRDSFFEHYAGLLASTRANCDTTTLLEFRNSLLDDPVLADMKKSHKGFMKEKRTLDLQREAILDSCRRVKKKPL